MAPRSSRSPVLKNLLTVGGSLLVGALAGQLALELRLIVSPYEVHGCPAPPPRPALPPLSEGVPTPLLGVSHPIRHRNNRPWVQRVVVPDIEPHLREPGDIVREANTGSYR